MVPSRTIAEALRGHSNSLGLIRLVLASLVIFDHAFPLGGFGADPFWRLTNGQASLGSFAVGGFFAVSGYLIAKSAMNADTMQYLWRRVLRIFPAYWGVLLVGLLLVGPVWWLAQGRDLGDYFTWAPGGPAYYFTANWTLQIGTYGIHDVFLSTPYGEEVQGSVLNGSLWTLAYEFGCYLLLALLAAAAVLAKARIIVPIITAFLFVGQVVWAVAPDRVGALLPMFVDPQLVTLSYIFLLGSTIAVYSDRVPFDDRLGILSILVFAFTARVGGYATIGLMAGAYLVLYLGARLPRKVQWIGAKNDYSYGVYIYGFLVQQSLAALGVQHWGYLPYALLALLISFVCAWFSWHCIEKHAMALKNWGPGKGLGYWRDRMRLRAAPDGTGS